MIACACKILTVDVKPELKSNVLNIGLLCKAVLAGA